MSKENENQYTLMELRKKDLDPDPFRQFEKWYKDALNSDIKYPDAVALSTSHEGNVSSRIVLLKGIDDKGFRFYTNSNSRKGTDLKNNPRASMCFWWEPLERQVRISGRVELLPAALAEEYFSTRPRGSQLSAWASSQSEIIVDRESLDELYREYEEIFRNREIPKPEFWNGYRVIPSNFEFWQGRPDRLHDRLKYVTDDSGRWIIQRLQP